MTDLTTQTPATQAGLIVQIPKASQPPARKTFWRRYRYHLVALAATLVVFWFYTRPDFLVMLADQMWSCF